MRRLLDDKFFDLLDAGAEEARNSVRLLRRFLETGGESAAAFAAVRQNCNRIYQEIRSKLVTTIMPSLRKEDIEALSRALLLISQAAERFVQRAGLAADRPASLDFSRPVSLLEQAMATVVAMVNLLRGFESLGRTGVLQVGLQEATDRAETLVEELIGGLYRGADDPLRMVIAKDLCDRMLEIVDRCRAVGPIVSQIVLEYM